MGHQLLHDAVEAPPLRLRSGQALSPKKRETMASHGSYAAFVRLRQQLLITT